MSYERQVAKQFNNDEDRPLRVLYYDIENSPLLSYNWGIYEQNAVRVEKEWFIMAVGWKWMGEKNCDVIALTDFKEFKKDPQNDYALVKRTWELFQEADVLITHNGIRHDQRKMNARFIYHGLTPPTPYQEIDTLRIAKRKFAFTSNRLNDLGQYLGVGKKVRIHPDVWNDCMKGSRSAYELMKKYNKQDVLLLEKVYLKLRAWMPNHPSLGVSGPRRPSFASKEGLLCPRCGSDRLSSMGWRRTAASRYRRYQCLKCGGWTASSVRFPIKKEMRAI